MLKVNGIRVSIHDENSDLNLKLEKDGFQIVEWTFSSDADVVELMLLDRLMNKKNVIYFLLIDFLPYEYVLTDLLISYLRKNALDLVFLNSRYKELAENLNQQHYAIFRKFRTMEEFHRRESQNAQEN